MTPTVPMAAASCLSMPGTQPATQSAKARHQSWCAYSTERYGAAGVVGNEVFRETKRFGFAVRQRPGAQVVDVLDDISGENLQPQR